MSLNWDATTIPESVRTEYRGALQTAVFNSMIIGIGELSPKTLAEAMVRTKIIEGLDGPLLDSDKGPRYLHELLPKFVGLKTNVSFESRSAWLRRIYTYTIGEMEKKLTATQTAN